MSALPPVVVMGVSGSGKTTIARGVADRLGLRLVEGDELHPAANVAKMASGVPLDDEDRRPWLDAVAERLEPGVVVTCSALKRSYRDRLRAAAPDLIVLYLDVPREVLAARVAHRVHEYMPATLLDSQLATLEKPLNENGVVVLDGTRTPDEIVTAATERLETS
jgi:gluconokinase